MHSTFLNYNNIVHSIMLFLVVNLFFKHDHFLISSFSVQDMISFATCTMHSGGWKYIFNLILRYNIHRAIVFRIIWFFFRNILSGLLFQGSFNEMKWIFYASLIIKRYFYFKLSIYQLKDVIINESLLHWRC